MTEATEALIREETLQSGVESLEDKIIAGETQIKALLPEFIVPPETTAWAKKTAEKIKRRCKGDNELLAQAVYEKQGNRLRWNEWSYGFEEALKTGNYAPFPHEIKKRAQCFGFAVAQYFLAKELGLNPKMKNAIGIKVKSLDNGNIDRHWKGDHFIVEIDPGGKQSILIDSLLSLYGPVTYYPHRFRLKENETTVHLGATFDCLIEYTEQELLKKINYLRTPTGSIEMLKTSEVVASRNNEVSAIKYEPSPNTIEIQIRATELFEYRAKVPTNRGYNNRIKLDQKARVQESELTMCFFDECQWDSLDSAVIIDSFSLDCSLSYATIAGRQQREWREQKTKKANNKKDHKKNNDKTKDDKPKEKLRLSDMLKHFYRNNISIENLEDGIKTLDQKNIDEPIKTQINWAAERLRMLHSLFLKREERKKALGEGLLNAPQKDTKEVESFMKADVIIEAYGEYQEKLANAIKEGKDYNGFLYSEKARRGVFLKEFHKANVFYVKRIIPLLEKEFLAKCGFEKNSGISSRKRNNWRQYKPLEDLIGAIGSCHKERRDAYNLLTDEQIFLDKKFHRLKDFNSDFKSFYKAPDNAEKNPTRNFIAYAIIIDDFLRNIYDNFKEAITLPKYVSQVQKRVRAYLREKKQEELAQKSSFSVST